MIKERRKTEIVEISVEDETRRAHGVHQLVSVMDHKPEAGKSYHILTGGQVDLISHLWWLMRHWPKMKMVLISAWAISGTDILLMDRWIKEGKIEQFELLVGDIFPTKYKMEWKKLMEMYDAGSLKKVNKATIHSKLLLMESEDGTKLVIESSANCNMNPRVEQSCVTVSDKLYNFYYTYLQEMLDEAEARRTVRELQQLPFDEYIDNDEGVA